MNKDLMYRGEIEQLVFDAYTDLATPGGPASRFYTTDQLASLPQGARLGPRGWQPRPLS